MTEVQWVQDKTDHGTQLAPLRVPLSALWHWAPFFALLLMAVVAFFVRGCGSSPTFDDFDDLAPLTSAKICILAVWALTTAFVLWRLVRLFASRGQFVGLSPAGLYLGHRRRGAFLPWEQLRAIEGRRLEKPLGFFRRVVSRQKVLFCVDSSFAEQIRRDLTPAFTVAKPDEDIPGDHSRIGFNCSLIALDPVILLTLGRFYRQVPAARSELTTVSSLERFRGQLA